MTNDDVSGPSGYRDSEPRLGLREITSNTGRADRLQAPGWQGAGRPDTDRNPAAEPRDGRLADRLEIIAEIDRELEAAIEYKLATGEEAVGEILDIVARAVERRRRELMDGD